MRLNFHFQDNKTTNHSQPFCYHLERCQCITEGITHSDVTIPPLQTDFDSLK